METLPIAASEFSRDSRGIRAYRFFLKDPLNEILASYSRFNAARSLGQPGDSEFEVHRFGDALALIDPARPGSVMCNRVLGLSEKSAPQLKDILAAYDAAGAVAHFDISGENLFPSVLEPLVKRGFTAKEATTYLTTNPRKVRQTATQDSKLSLERWNDERVDEFLKLLETSGVECAPDRWARRREQYCTDTFRVYVASWEGVPCAWGTIFVERNVGYFANAFTQEDYRRRGCQLALLNARLDEAKDLGLRNVYTDVVADSESHRNCKRAGFTKLTVVTTWTKE